MVPCGISGSAFTRPSSWVRSFHIVRAFSPFTSLTSTSACWMGLSSIVVACRRRPQRPHGPVFLALHKFDVPVGVLYALAIHRVDLHIDHGLRRFGPGP